MDTSNDPAFIAMAAAVQHGEVFLRLTDGSTHSFPVSYYPRLADAPEESLKNVALRVGGRALWWEDLDEDIWVADAIMQRYPASAPTRVAEKPDRYSKEKGEPFGQ